MAVLDERALRQRIGTEAASVLDELECFDAVDSTSTYLLDQPSPDVGRWRIALAATQTAGRGRGDNRWYSPPGGGLWMSGAYTFDTLPSNLSALTLAIGVGAANTLAELKLDDVQLKWPNDLLVGGCKIGGILLDSASAASTHLTVVCGLGLNVNLGDIDAARSAMRGNGFPPTDLATVLTDVPPMETLAALFIDSLVHTVSRYEREGFQAFAREWRAYDCLRDSHVVVMQREHTRRGIACGISDNGALILREGDELHYVVSGSVHTVSSGAEA